MGLGIWSMHYLGMLALQLGMEVNYFLPTVLVSLLLAIGAAAVALTVVAAERLTRLRLVVGGALMGAGIGGMHYTGMAAMRLPAMHHYSAPLVAASVVDAVVLSCLALWLGFSLEHSRSAHFARPLAAVVMGLAIASMHYIAMAAVTFMPEPMPYSLVDTIRISALGEAAIVVITVLVLAAALGSAAADRRRYIELQLAQEHLIRTQGELMRQQTELLETQKRLVEANALLNELSIRDSLTGLHNRRHFDAILATEWRRAQRGESPLALLLIDVDFFKRLNDSLGHVAGDDYLRRIARALESRPLRSHDLIARYGGEEIAVLLPGAPIEIARDIADQLRQRVESEQMEHPGSRISRFVTVSVGVCSRIPAAGEPVEGLIRDADTALYMAKEKGRNRVEATCGLTSQSIESSTQDLLA